MLVLINSTVNQAGVSTLARSIAYTYSNWVNRPVLIVSIKSDRYYKAKGNIKPEYGSKFLSIVNGNTGGHGDLKAYTYKINELLFYYQAHSSPAASKTQHELELDTFLERASREFGVVILDLDNETNSIKRFLDIADICLTVLPPDRMVVEDAYLDIQEVLEDYREEGGLAVKTKMCYIINKSLRVGLSKAEAAKILKAAPKDVFTVPYDPRIINEGNANKYTTFLADVILHKKAPEDKVLEVSLKRLYDVLKKL